MNHRRKRANQLDQIIRSGGDIVDGSLAKKPKGPLNPRERAEYLDQVIRQGWQTYKVVGLALFEMREDRRYLDLDPPCSNFEDYVWTVEELRRTQAKDLIRTAIVAEALESGAANGGPSTFKQAKAIADNVAKWKWEETRTDKGTPLKRVVGILNPEVVQNQWAKVCEKYEAAKARYQEANPGQKYPIRMGGTWIFRHLPRQFQGDKPIPFANVDRRWIGSLQSRMSLACKQIERYPDKEKVKGIAAREKWSTEDLGALRDTCRETMGLIEDLLQMVRGIRP